jgi:DNA-binding ferritin-like protein (Dps family)
MKQGDVEVGEIMTELVIEDQGVGSLTGEDLRKVIDAVMQHLAAHRDRERQRQADTGIRNRAYCPEGQQH